MWGIVSINVASVVALIVSLVRINIVLVAIASVLLVIVAIILLVIIARIVLVIIATVVLSLRFGGSSQMEAGFICDGRLGNKMVGGGKLLRSIEFNRIDVEVIMFILHSMRSIKAVVISSFLVGVEDVMFALIFLLVSTLFIEVLADVGNSVVYECLLVLVSLGTEVEVIEAGLD